MRTLIHVVVVVLLVASARTARANSAAPFSRPTGAVPGIVVARVVRHGRTRGPCDRLRDERLGGPPRMYVPRDLLPREPDDGRRGAARRLLLRVAEPGVPHVRRVVATSDRFPGRPRRDRVHDERAARFGYELGIGSSLVFGATADTNFGKYVTAAMTLDAATPSFIFVIPSLAFGAGVPVQFREKADPRVGVRTQMTIAFPLVRVSFPLDFYPRENSSGSHFEGSFVTAISF